jgi:uncharacterized hydrophobic protein (TIGR00341 family)
MPARKIEIFADAGVADTIKAVADHNSDILSCSITTTEDGQCVAHLVIGSGDRQEVIDRLQKGIGGTPNWRIVILPIDATIPTLEEEAGSQAHKTGATREEIYLNVTRDARIDRDYLLLVFLSTIVAAIGLSENNTAVVIGAMVIAPLLGPNLALILAAALGDRKLAIEALGALGAGIAFAVSVAAVLGLVHGVDLGSRELVMRSYVSADSAILALASGAAAALSVSTGLSSALVGVMVAVALLPPAAAIGLFLGAGAPNLAMGAALLLTVNIASVNLSGQIVFFLRGVRPRSWLEKRSAGQSTLISVGVWLILLALLLAAIWLRNLRP